MNHDALHELVRSLNPVASGSEPPPSYPSRASLLDRINERTVMQDTEVREVETPGPRRRSWMKPAFAGAAAIAAAVVIAIIVFSGNGPEVLDPTPTSVTSTIPSTTTVPSTTTSTTIAVEPLLGEVIPGAWASSWGRIEFTADNTFSVSDDTGDVTDEGTYRFFEPTLQLTFVSEGSARCGDGNGTYRYEVRDATNIGLTLLADDCDQRALALDNTRLTPALSP